MGEVAAVTRIDDTLFGNGQPGPVTLKISRLFEQLVERECPA